MDEIPITLIVKAPNQQIEDQTIKCELTWTIKKLKGYLSEVYPSKPKTDEQKLIYSGQLLPDSFVLKDILRRYEGQEAYTVHLVCTPSSNSQRQNKPPSNLDKEQNKTMGVDQAERTQIANVPSASSSSRTTPEESVTSTKSTPTTTSPSTSQTVPSSEFSVSSSTVPRISHVDSTTAQNNSGNRQEVPITAAADPRLAWTAAMASQPYMGATPNDPQVFAAQMAWYQQAYANYITQYMNMYCNSVTQNQNVVHNPQENELNIQRIPNNAPPLENNMPDGGAMPQVPAAAAGAPFENEEPLLDRDWLDWFYVLSRVIVLFSVVYFYSSPIRFIVVITIGFIIYLYQMGFFRPDNINNNNLINRVENNNNQQNVDNVQEVPPAPEPIVADNVAPDPQPENVPLINAQRPLIEPDRPTVFSVMWTFFVTFFSSLIPEIPNAV